MTSLATAHLRSLQPPDIAQLGGVHTSEPPLTSRSEAALIRLRDASVDAIDLALTDPDPLAILTLDATAATSIATAFAPATQWALLVDLDLTRHPGFAWTSVPHVDDADQVTTASIAATALTAFTHRLLINLIDSAFRVLAVQPVSGEQARQFMSVIESLDFRTAVPGREVLENDSGERLFWLTTITPEQVGELTSSATPLSDGFGGLDAIEDMAATYLMVADGADVIAVERYATPQIAAARFETVRAPIRSGFISGNDSLPSTTATHRWTDGRGTTRPGRTVVRP
jgi:hypothetical protein